MVATDIRGCRQADDGVTGLLVPVRSPGRWPTHSAPLIGEVSVAAICEGFATAGRRGPFRPESGHRHDPAEAYRRLGSRPCSVRSTPQLLHGCVPPTAPGRLIWPAAGSNGQQRAPIRGIGRNPCRMGCGPDGADRGGRRPARSRRLRPPEPTTRPRRRSGGEHRPTMERSHILEVGHRYPNSSTSPSPSANWPTRPVHPREAGQTTEEWIDSMLREAGPSPRCSPSPITGTSPIPSAARPATARRGSSPTTTAGGGAGEQSSSTAGCASSQGLSAARLNRSATGPGVRTRKWSAPATSPA